MLKFFKKSDKSIPLDERVPIREKLALAAGSPLEQFTVWQPLFMVVPVINWALGTDPAKIAGLFGLFRLWDAFTDPIIANFSDNFRSKWGRRRPFILVGSLLCAILTPMMFHVNPEWSEPHMFGYLAVVGILLYTSFTIFCMGWAALACEMTPNTDERVTVFGWRTAGTKIAAIACGMLWWVYKLDIFQMRDASGALVYDGSGNVEVDQVRALGAIGIGLGIAILFLGPQAAIWCKERYYEKASQADKMSLIKGFKETISNRTFLVVVFIVLSQFVGIMMVKSLGLYVNRFKVCAGDMALATYIQGYVEMTQFAVAMLAIPLWVKAGQFLEKNKAILLIVTINVIGYLSMLVFYTPVNPWLQIVPQVILGISAPSIWIFIPAMLADTIDLDELKTGRRREGSYNAVFTWSFKFSIAAVVMISGVVINWSGFDIEQFNANGSVPKDILDRMHYMYVFVPVSLSLVGLFLSTRYKLTRKKMAEIRAQLEERRGTV